MASLLVLYGVLVLGSGLGTEGRHRHHFKRPEGHGKHADGEPSYVDWKTHHGPWANVPDEWNVHDHEGNGNTGVRLERHPIQSPLVNYTSDVFLEKEDGIATYRIPAIVQVGKPLGGEPPVLLAFAEARKDSSSDCGRKAVVVKSSTDMGKTWGKLVVSQ